ncbi:hypothetical protein DPMN_173342 [Dreissena polymorpha]|uniref:Uncharacterized protein n=1 Tax=Dreissena polymorpha TaxID=45954 RepID=A0A9D4IE44_DREPO|nr:hypothetical protein DPMN_173342 [Dreissena polymorpha]
MMNVVTALSEEVSNTRSNDEHRFQQQFFCYVTLLKDFNTSMEYLAGLYFYFPTNIFAYSCCELNYDYSNGTYSEPECNQKQNKWTMCTTGPYIVGILILILFPLFGFNLLGAISKSEIIQPYDYERLNISASLSQRKTTIDIVRSAFENGIRLQTESFVNVFPSEAIFVRA